MVWESDFMATECGYMVDDENMEHDENGILVGDKVIHIFGCSECGTTVEYEDLEDEGKMAILSTTQPSEDGDDQSIAYSLYAQNKYGMPTNID